MRIVAGCLAFMGVLVAGPAAADSARDEAAYAATLQQFRASSASGRLFDRSYGYAVFPRVGKVAFALGGASGKGRVYVAGRHVGNARLSQLSLGLSVGVQSYREIVFFEDERAFREFASGSFEFGADASLVLVRAGAAASAGTQGVSAGVGDERSLSTAGGGYYKGMAAFAVPLYGGMIEWGIGGQRFSYTPLVQAEAGPAQAPVSAPAGPEPAVEPLVPVEALAPLPP